MRAMRWIFIEGASGLSATATSADETVVTAVPQSDGTVTINSSGGTGPYTVDSLDGYGTLYGASVTFTGLPGTIDYNFLVTDSLGATFPLTIHVFRQAYDVYVQRSATKSLTNTGWTATLGFGQFDPAWGSLISVTLVQVAWTLRTNGRLENLDTSPHTVSHGANGTVTLKDAAGVLLTSQSLTKTFTNSLAAYDGNADFAGTSGVSNAAANVSATTTVSASASGSLTPYIGAGTIGLAAAGSASSFYTGTPSAAQSNTPQVGVTFTIEYHGYVARA